MEDKMILAINEARKTMNEDKGGPFGAVITDLDGNNPIKKIVNDNYVRLVYKVGEYVYPDSFDEYRWNECSHGIHFFMNKEDAIDY